jgi:hypothetical protein
LVTPHGGIRRRFIDRLGDAQGNAGHGRFLLITFLSEKKSNNEIIRPVSIENLSPPSDVEG